MKIERAAIGVAVLLVACTSPQPASSTDTAATPAASTQQSTPAPNRTTVATACPHDGKWALCSIERRLKQSGYVVKRMEQDTIRRAGFSVKPTVYTLGRSRVEIFLYRDSASAARDVATLDTLVVGPVGKPGQWGDVPPTLIRSANIAAVILSGSAVQTERIMLALTAGPPQPGSPR